MATSESKPKEKGLILRRCIDFVFGFENKKGDILDSWIYFADSFNFPPKEFYAAIEKEMTARKIPGMEISREEFSEGGLLSDKRIYLRLFRERLALYTCAAPFGTGYFFSFRAVYVPALVRLWHILVLWFFFGVINALLIALLGFTFAGVAFITLLFAIAAVFRNATGAGFGDLDTLLLKMVPRRYLLSHRHEDLVFADPARDRAKACRRSYGGQRRQAASAAGKPAGLERAWQKPALDSAEAMIFHALGS